MAARVVLDAARRSRRDVNASIVMGRRVRGTTRVVVAVVSALRQRVPMLEMLKPWDVTARAYIRYLDAVEHCLDSVLTRS